MIQALGTLKLFKDIDEDNIIEGFEFSQFSSLEEANDNDVFYTPIDQDSEDSKYMKRILFDYFKQNNKNLQVYIKHTLINWFI